MFKFIPLFLMLMTMTHYSHAQEQVGSERQQVMKLSEVGSFLSKNPTHLSHLKEWFKKFEESGIADNCFEEQYSNDLELNEAMGTFNKVIKEMSYVDSDHRANLDHDRGRDYRNVSELMEPPKANE